MKLKCLETFFSRFTEEIRNQLEASNARAIIGTPKTFASIKEAVQNLQKNIKIICIKTDANDAIPNGAINFADLIDTNSTNSMKCVVNRVFHDSNL